MSEATDQDDAWACRACGQGNGKAFDVCWNCGTSRTGTPDPAFEREPGAEAAMARSVDESRPAVDTITCARCTRPLEYVGRKRFHEGTNWGFLGEIGEFFVKREHFDVYVCPRCGRVEFFVDGIGEEFRPQ